MSKRSAIEQATDPTGVFDSLFSTHHETVLRYCVRRLGRFDAEDAAAEVFAVAWRRLDDIPEGESARAWLVGVAHKVVGNRYRARRRQIRLFGRLESEHRVTGLAGPTRDADVHLLHLALNGLKATDREMIRLSAWDGLTRDEMAYVLGIEVNAVDQRLHRARTRLKARLDRLTPSGPTAEPEETSA